MKYQEFRAYRDRVVAERSPVRLDCMNPGKALASLRRTGAEAPMDPTPHGLVAAWAKALGAAHPSDIATGAGVRELLAALFGRMRDSEAQGTLWLPEDVYPMYLDLAAGCRVRTFATIQAALSGDRFAAAGGRDTLLLPNPLVPEGRYLGGAEIDGLSAWLHAAKARTLILDAVYAYADPLGRGVEALLATGQCVVLASLSKTWLAEGVLGIASGPAHLVAPICERVPALDRAARARAAMALLDADLPVRQRDLFARRWRGLQPALARVDPRWRPPESGYFAVVAAPAAQILERANVLCVPASVFGSSREDLSVVTCLHESLEPRR